MSRSFHPPASAMLFAVNGMPQVQPDDDIAELILGALADEGRQLISGDIIVIAQKIISKSENRYVTLDSATPSLDALKLAQETGKDPRIIELILSESTEVMRARPGLIIVRHRLGFVLANAGIDQSNIPSGENGDTVLLLPEDPSASCRQIKQCLKQRIGADVAVVINDSIGRAWRLGTVGTAIGSAGLSMLIDLRGRPDLYGRPMKTSMTAIGDQVASMASLMQGECDEGNPVVVCRGFGAFLGDGATESLVRPIHEDLFQ